MRNLTISNASGVKLSAPTSVSGTLTLTTGVFNLNNLALTLLSSSSGTAQLAAVGASASFSNAGNFAAQRWLDPAAITSVGSNNGAYYWVGSPVAGKTVNAWEQAGNNYNPSTFDNSDPRHSSVWLYNPADNTVPVNGGWIKPASASQAAGIGTGLRVWFGNSFFTQGAVTTLSGTPVTGNYSMPVSYCSGTCAGNTPANGWNLVANPYASTIDWDSPSKTAVNVANAIYVWRNKLNAYASYVNGIGVNGGNHLIASGQGFMVQATAASPRLTFTENIKTTASASLLRAASASLLRLKLEVPGQADETVLADRSGGLADFEPEFDAEKLTNPDLNIWMAPTAAAAQAIASLDLNNVQSVPLRVKSSTACTAVLSVTDFTDLQNRFNISLIDDESAQVQALDPAVSVPLALQAGQTKNLTLLLESKVLGTSALKPVAANLYPNPSNGTCTLTGTDLKHVQVTDNLGRVVYSAVLNGNDNLLNTNLPAGVYSARVLTGKGSAVLRLVVQ